MKRGGNTVFSWCRRIVCFSADGGASHPLPLAECLGEAVVTAFDYDNDAIGRRTARLDALPGDVAITNAFGYNMRSEVTQANMGINIYGYVFDPIGNRITATNNAEVTSYVANELNQYTNILCASAPLRDPSYDSDGNMTTTGDGWHYVWNGENRLVIASNAIHVVSYAYDHRGRMVRKNIAPSNASPSETIRYLWDDFNIIAETVASDSATNTTYNVWGLDLDGMLQGAGGVGGLLAVVKDTAIYIPAWDANGNIMEYVAEDGSIVAHREYDSFGGTVLAMGEADAFSHWFSTKPWCAITGLNEYQYRKYSPVLGRWLSRDPIGEIGGPNMFAFVGNNSLDYVDAFGDVQVKKDLIKKNERMTFNGRGIWGWTFEPELDSERAAKLRYDKKSCECRVRRKPELKFIIKIWVVKRGRQKWTEEARFDGVVYPDSPVYVSGALASAVLEHENRRFDAWSDGLKSYFGREYEDKAASLTAPTCPELAVKIADLRSTAFEQWSSSTDAAAVVEKLLQIGMEHTGTARVEFDSPWRGVYVEYDLSE